MVFDFLFIKDKTESCEFNSVGFGSWLSCFGSFSSSSNGAPNVFLILFIWIEFKNHNVNDLWFFTEINDNNNNKNYLASSVLI